MKVVAGFLYVLAILIGSFGYWGSFTRSGRKEYDEMAGIIPAFALLIAALFFLIALILTVILYVKRRKASQASRS